MKKKVIIVGAGHRSLCYASYAKFVPEEMEIVGVADPIPERRAFTAKEYNLTPEQCFYDVADLLTHGKIADAVINGTMDHQHVDTTIPLLEAGYDVLLEKPFAVNQDELKKLDDAAKRTGRVVMICHVLRYAPFYAEIKKRICAGEIGQIINIQATEHVSYHHYIVGYVRGKWRSKEIGGSSFLLAKSCHDLDLIVWMKSGVAPTFVSSFGGLHFFRPECAPKNSGQFCLLDCPHEVEQACPYSVRKLCLDHPERWGAYIWPELDYQPERNTPEEREKMLRNPKDHNARCAWKCDNKLADRQTVMIDFADGATATLNLIGNCSRPQRKIHIIGTTGEIEGVLDENKFIIRHFDLSPGHEYSETVIDTGDMGDTTGAQGGHGGGDLRLVKDFIALLNQQKHSISCTILDDSIAGHKIGFAADWSMENHQTVDLRNSL